MLWVVFYALLGALNLLLAFYGASTSWVNFKVIGLPILNFVFVGRRSSG